MANADFSQNQNPNPGGFDAGSYREAAPKTETARLTPAQQKLAGLEAALPAALRTQGAALALSVVVMLAAFFGFGGAKITMVPALKDWEIILISGTGPVVLYLFLADSCLLSDKLPLPACWLRRSSFPRVPEH